MFEDEVLKPHEKLKKTRETYGITQQELAEGIVSRNYISHVESKDNNQNLSYKTAIKIAERFNELTIKKKGVQANITAQYLLEDDNTQANRLIEQKIEHLEEFINKNDKENFLFKLGNIEKFLNRYFNLIGEEKKIKIYEITADYLFRIVEHTKSLIYAEKGISISMRLKNSIKTSIFLIKQAKVYISKKNDNEALQKLEQAETLLKEIENNEAIKLSKEIFFYKARVYFNLEKYDFCFSILRKLEENDLGDSEHYKIKMVHSNCLIKLNKLDEAESNYIEILDYAMKRNNRPTIARCYRNLAEIYYKRKDYITAAKNIKEALKRQPCTTTYSEHLLYAGVIYINLDISIAENYLLKSLQQTIKEENNNLTKKALYQLFKIYAEQNNESKLNSVILEAQKLNFELILLEEVYRHIEPKDLKSKNLLHHSINLIKDRDKIEEY